MGTNFQYTSLRVGLVATSRVLTITTGAAQLLTLLTSGAILVNVQNNGPANMTLGDSAIIANSGDVSSPTPPESSIRSWIPLASMSVLPLR